MRLCAGTPEDFVQDGERPGQAVILEFKQET